MGGGDYSLSTSALPPRVVAATINCSKKLAKFSALRAQYWKFYYTIIIIILYFFSQNICIPPPEINAKYLAKIETIYPYRWEPYFRTVSGFKDIGIRKIEFVAKT